MRGDEIRIQLEVIRALCAEEFLHSFEAGRAVRPLALSLGTVSRQAAAGSRQAAAGRPMALRFARRLGRRFARLSGRHGHLATELVAS